MESTARRWTLLAAAPVVVALASGPALRAQTDDSRHVLEKKIEISCKDGEDCASEARQIFISSDDQTHVIQLDGDHGVSWVGDDGNVFSYESAHGGFLGIQLTDITPELREHFGVPADQGVLVSSVVDDSPAWRAGIEVGDIITAVSGQGVTSAGSLARAVGGHDPGTMVDVELWRDGRVQTVSATLDKRQELPKRVGARVLLHCDGDDDCKKVDLNGSDAFVFKGDGLFKSGAHALACGDGESCEITVECRDSDCTCTMNGESKSCDELEGLNAFKLRRKQQQQQ